VDLVKEKRNLVDLGKRKRSQATQKRREKRSQVVLKRRKRKKDLVHEL